jgi:hypothetical protein
MAGDLRKRLDALERMGEQKWRGAVWWVPVEEGQDPLEALAVAHELAGPSAEQRMFLVWRPVQTQGA